MFALTDPKLLIVPIALVAWAFAYRSGTRWWLFLGIQLAAASITELLALWQPHVEGSNLALYNAYMPVEYTALSLMMLHLPARERHRWILTSALWLLFMAAYTAELLWKAQGATFGFLNLSLVMSGSLLAVQAFASLYRTVALGPLDRTGAAGLWVLASVCMYFISSTPVFGLIGHYSMADPEVAIALLGLNDGLFILRYGLVTMGLVVLARQRTFSTWSARMS
jgi:hypothetical protein